MNDLETLIEANTKLKGEIRRWEERVMELDRRLSHVRRATEGLHNDDVRRDKIERVIAKWRGYLEPGMTNGEIKNLIDQLIEATR